MSDHDVADHRKRAGKYCDAGLAIDRSEGERVGLPRLVFPGEALLDIATREAFPSAMADLPQAVAVDRRETVRHRKDIRGFDRAAQGTAIDGGDLLFRESRREIPHLSASFVGQIDADRAGKTVFGRELGRAVS